MSKEDKADRNLSILVQYNKFVPTAEIAKQHVCSIRTVQAVIKGFRERGYAALYSQPVVETDKYIDGKLSGVTVYKREPINA